MEPEVRRATDEDGEKAATLARRQDRTRRSMQAIANLRAICETRLRGRYEPEVVDTDQHPRLARDEQVVAAPTLIERLPLPGRRMVGNLSDLERVLAGLDLRVRTE